MTVFGMVSAVAGFVKVRYLIDKAMIDNMVFRAHYRITSAILFLSCIIVTANNLIGKFQIRVGHKTINCSQQCFSQLHPRWELKDHSGVVYKIHCKDCSGTHTGQTSQYLHKRGDPIQCINDRGVPGHVINTYCWITYTFTLPHQQGLPVGSHVAHPGLGNDNQEKQYHSYYQWVPFVLFFQGVMFYVPHWIWKNWEQGKIRMVTEGLRGSLVGEKTDREFRQNRLVQYLVETMHLHNSYAFGYFFCEALNFVNVMLNIFMTDKFLGGAFLTYGTDVVSFSNMNQENRTDPMVAVFPRVTKCIFHKFGPSGSIQKHDALCILALNILNEKIYIFLWFWFIILAVFSGLAIVYSAAVVMLPNTRETILKRRFRFGAPNAVDTIVRKTQVGDFLVLHLLGQNTNQLVFGEILDELVRRLNFGSNSNLPSAPSTLEMSPIYPEIEKFKETET